MACSASVVLPDDSGPKTSIMRPRGKPFPPRAKSTDRLPVEIPSICIWQSAPRGMMEPSPNSFSIWASVFFSSGFASIKDRPVGLLRRPALASGCFDSFGAESLFDFAIRPLTPIVATVATITMRCASYSFPVRRRGGLHSHHKSNDFPQKQILNASIVSDFLPAGKRFF